MTTDKSETPLNGHLRRLAGLIDYDWGCYLIEAAEEIEALVEAVKLVQGFDWRLDESAYGIEIKRRAEAAVTRATTAYRSPAAMLAEKRRRDAAE
jgi:hypothetical protein